MEFDFSSAKTKKKNLSIGLHAVYCLHADSSYDVRKNYRGFEEWIVLRTFAGEGRLKLEGHPEIRVTAGTLLYFRHQDVRRYCCAGDIWYFYWFEFACEERLGFPLNTLMPIDSPEHEQEDCRTILELLRREEEDATPRASAFLCLLFYKWRMSLGAGEKKSPYHQLIRQILHEVNSCSDGNVSVRSMAGNAGLCERRFRQVFEQEMGMSPKKYLESMKMKTAEALLQNTSMLLGEISERLGYCNSFHFSRRFQATHGMPPSQYRKK